MSYPPRPTVGRPELGVRPHLYLQAVILVTLADAGHPVGVAALVGELARHGVRFTGRPSKSVSDALRCHLRAGRAVRVRRGVYRLGDRPIPPTTMWRHRRRAEALREGGGMVW